MCVAQIEFDRLGGHLGASRRAGARSGGTREASGAMRVSSALCAAARAARAARARACAPAQARRAPIQRSACPALAEAPAQATNRCAALASGSERAGERAPPSARHAWPARWRAWGLAPADRIMVIHDVLPAASQLPCLHVIVRTRTGAARARHPLARPRSPPHHHPARDVYLPVAKALIWASSSAILKSGGSRNALF